VAAEYPAFMRPTSRGRRLKSDLIVLAALAATIVALIPLLSVFLFIVGQGAGAVRPELFLEDPPGVASATPSPARSR